jgi:fructokinase
MTKEQAGLDLYAVGEVVIDFISTSMADSLATAKKFHSFVGGQPANLVIDMAMLGRSTALAACVGTDTFGGMITNFLNDYGVNTDFIQTTDLAPTSTAIIARHTKTPDFVINRGADTCLRFNSDQQEVIASSRIVHSSAFALAREPARSAVIETLKIARDNECLVTFDPNFHPKIWSDSGDMIDHLNSIYQFVDVSKPSLDDCERIFGDRLSPKECAERFLEWGPSVVMITKGSEGVFLATADGDSYDIYPKEVDVADVTGAGDAFWAGYLSSILDGRSQLEAACFGQVVAEAKVSVMGPITEMPAINVLKEHAKAVEYSRL